MEYLMTYSWAVLIIAIVLVALFSIGLFNPGSIVTSQCVLPAGLSCPSVSLSSNGLLQFSLLQVTETPINITAIGCNTNDTVSHMYQPYNPVTTGNQIKLLIGANYTFAVPCWSGSATFSTSAGTSFRGYMILNYTDTTSGFPHTIIGQLAVKVV
jgi:hypothetical protein